MINNTDKKINYVGYYFYHSKHRNLNVVVLDNYIESIVEYFTILSTKSLFFVTDSYTYNLIKKRIEPRDNHIIRIMELSDTETYCKYSSKIFEKLTNDDRNELLSNIIWFFKFELIRMAKDYYSKNEYTLYLDSGIFNGKRHFIQEFIQSGLEIKKCNDILINYKEEWMQKDIDYYRLINYGDYEISCNHMLFHNSIIDTISKLFFEKLENVIDGDDFRVRIQEQIVFTLAMREYYINNKEKFFFSYHKTSYFIGLHLN